MSTRYVWNVYNTKDEYKSEYSTSRGEEIGVNGSYAYIGAYAKEITFDEGIGYYTLTGLNWVTIGTIGTGSVKDYPYFVALLSDNAPASIRARNYVYGVRGTASTELYWSLFWDTSDAKRYLILLDRAVSGGTSGYNFNNYYAKYPEYNSYYRSTEKAQGDTKTGTVSSASSTAHPTDGASGSSWYVLEGSDSIDPLNVTYDTDRPERGKAVKVIARPAENPLKWNQTTMPEKASWEITAYGGGRFIASGTIYSFSDFEYIDAYSTDGITWSSLPSSEYLHELVSCTYGNGKFVGISHGGEGIVYSTDGTDWTFKELPIDEGKWSRIAFGGGRFVIAANKSRFSAYSTDGINWTISESMPRTTGTSLGYPAYGGGKFVFPEGGSSVVYCTTDGINWTYTLFAGTGMSVVYCNERFIGISSSDGEVLESFDGTNWTEISQVPGGVHLMSGVAYGDGKIVLIASQYGDEDRTHSFCSSDGIDWEEIPFPSDEGWHGPVYGDGRFVTAGGYKYENSEFVHSGKAAYTTTGLGGTTSYQYQYSTDGGKTWADAGTSTTDTEKDIIVPEKAEWFMARVRAQDDMGFVSNDYVSGPNLAVQTVRAWVGVDGVARRVKRVWIGVDGKAKEVTNGWVGDENGKARRFF